MSREKRKSLIEEIEKKRNSRVISYITSTRRNLWAQIAGDAVPILYEHIRMAPPKQRTKMDLFLYSPGGISDVPWTIVSMFRECCNKGSFGVLIPYHAHSAATVVALGADEIVMTEKAELGPIDITMRGDPYNPRDPQTQAPLPVSVEDVMGYFTLLEKIGCERATEKMQGFEQITPHVHPLVLGKVSRLLEQQRQIAFKVLSTRTKPFSEEQNKEIIKRLTSEIYSHSYAIHRTEANQMGLDQVTWAEKAKIDQEMWDLYVEYLNLLSFESPFLPEEYLIAHNVEEHTWEDLPLACIESTDRLDVCRQSQKVKCLRQVPPKVNLNISPTLNIPPNLSPQQFGQWINQLFQQMLPGLIQQAAAELTRSLPAAGYQRSPFNTGWKKEK